VGLKQEGIRIRAEQAEAERLKAEAEAEKIKEESKILPKKKAGSKK
jgi:hypothetical protein